MTKQIKEIDISSLTEEYSPDRSIFCEDDELITKIKIIIADKLDEPERRILLLYTDKMSLRVSAKLLGVSPSTLNNKLKEIRNKIKEYL